MKLTSTKEEWAERHMTPRRWFAWRPVRCEDGSLVWLETVETWCELEPDLFGPAPYRYYRRVGL